MEREVTVEVSDLEALEMGPDGSVAGVIIRRRLEAAGADLARGEVQCTVLPHRAVTRYKWRLL